MKQPHCFMRDIGVCRVAIYANPKDVNVGITLNGIVYGAFIVLIVGLLFIVFH